jgi:hypothetical protein
LAPKPAPLRELPGTRKKEKTWRDEVNERVRSRRKKREEETGLPLFDQPATAEVPSEAARSSPEPETQPLAAEPARKAALRFEDAVIVSPADEAVADLPLRHSVDRAPSEGDEQPEASSQAAAPGVVAETPRRNAAAERPSQREVELGDEEPGRAADEDEEWRLELEPPIPESRPVERPAHFVERARAAAVDLALLSVMSLVVVYFASRAARVPIVGLLPAWPWLFGYLAFLGLAYATYFTGTTGQTLGKMLFDLRVVDTAGQPPG